MSEARRSTGEHPSPQRQGVQLPWLLAALAAGPAGWVLQLVTGYAVASHTCRPGDAPRLHAPPGGWAAERVGLLVLNLACLIVILAGGAIALQAWRRTRDQRPGIGAAAPEIGGIRTRFLAACGLLAAGAFALATLFDTAWPLFIPACWRFA